MPYLWNEKRFRKNSNGFEFHVDRYRTGEILAKIGEYFFCRPERVSVFKRLINFKEDKPLCQLTFSSHSITTHTFYWFVTHTSRRTPPKTSQLNKKPPTLFPTHQTATSYSPDRQLAHSVVPYLYTNVWFIKN